MSIAFAENPYNNSSEYRAHIANDDYVDHPLRSFCSCLRSTSRALTEPTSPG